MSFDITNDLIHRLIKEQFPEYSHLPIKPVEKQGHDNRSFRLGDEMLIRIPTDAQYALKVAKEQDLLPKLAPYLSVDIPAPIKMGFPSKIYQDIKKEDIWKIWTDVNNWPSWHGDLDYCKMEGKFAVGNYFFLKPKGVSPVKIVLTEITEGVSFTDCTKFLGAKMYYTHSLEETPEGLKLSNKLLVTGPLKWLWVFLVAKNVANSVPEEMESLVKLAKRK